MCNTKRACVQKQMRIAGYIILLQCVCEYLNPMKLVPGRSVCVRVCVGGEKGAKVNGGESASGREKGEEKGRAGGSEGKRKREREIEESGESRI